MVPLGWKKTKIPNRIGIIRDSKLCPFSSISKEGLEIAEKSLENTHKLIEININDIEKEILILGLVSLIKMFPNI